MVRNSLEEEEKKWGLKINLEKTFYMGCGPEAKEFIYCFTYFSPVIPSNTCVFLSCRPFVVNTTCSTGLVGVEVSSVSWLGQLTVGVKITDY